jgi:hypothetical protein
MPTIMTHAAVPLALAVGLGTRAVPPRLLAAGVVVAILPDADVVGFRLGVSYEDALGTAAPAIRFWRRCAAASPPAPSRDGSARALRSLSCS